MNWKMKEKQHQPKNESHNDLQRLSEYKNEHLWQSTQEWTKSILWKTAFKKIEWIWST